MRYTVIPLLLLAASPSTAQDRYSDLELNDRHVDAALMTGAGIAVAKEFTAGCVTSPFSTTPTGPQWTTNIDTGTNESVKLTAWRVPCSGADGQLLLTFTPLSGTPFICGPQLTVVQNSVQYSSMLLNASSTALQSVCANLFVPVTAYIFPSSNPSALDDDAGMALYYPNATGTPQQISVPAFNPADYQGVPAGDKALQGGLSGTYYASTRSGEGVLVDFGQVGGQPIVFFTWYTYAAGHQQWIVGSNAFAVSQSSITIDVINTSGAQFGAAFRPQDVVRSPWGNVSLRFPTCATLELTYRPLVGDSGVLALTRVLDRLGTAQCQ